MKTTFVKFGLFLALGLATTMFYSCDKNEKDDFKITKITANNVIGAPNQLTTTKVLAYWESNDDWGTDVIAQAPFKNNGFTLKLPETIEAK